MTDQVLADLEQLADAHIFVTGGTGFYGQSLLSRLRGLQIARGLRLPRLTVLSRNPERLIAKSPELTVLANLEFQKGDLTSLRLPADVTHVMHFAGTVSGTGGGTVSGTEGASPADVDLLRTTVIGTEVVLSEAARVGVRRVFYASSGAVYGRGYTDRCTEDSLLDVTQESDGRVRTAYGEAKRRAEALCLASPVPTVIARGFAFCGRYLPVDGPYALSDFVQSAVSGQPIEVCSPDTVRSYLHSTDLIDGMIAILTRGTDREAYNIGSEEAVTMLSLAHAVSDAVAEALGFRAEIRFSNQTRSTSMAAADVYLPATTKLRTLLSWHPEVAAPIQRHIAQFLEEHPEVFRSARPTKPQ